MTNLGTWDEQFEDTKGIMRSHTTYKNRQYIDQKKRSKDKKQNTTQKTKDLATRTTECESLMHISNIYVVD